LFLVLLQPSLQEHPPEKASRKLHDCHKDVDRCGENSIDDHKDKDLIGLISRNVEIIDRFGENPRKSVENSSVEELKYTNFDKQR
jgi:hypothetical protein